MVGLLRQRAAQKEGGKIGKALKEMMYCDIVGEDRMKYVRDLDLILQLYLLPRSYLAGKARFPHRL